jgi:hypothetical protein
VKTQEKDAYILYSPPHNLTRDNKDSHSGEGNVNITRRVNHRPTSSRGHHMAITAITRLHGGDTPAPHPSRDWVLAAVSTQNTSQPPIWGYEAVTSWADTRAYTSRIRLFSLIFCVTSPFFVSTPSYSYVGTLHLYSEGWDIRESRENRDQLTSWCKIFNPCPIRSLLKHDELFSSSYYPQSLVSTS